MEPEQVPQKTYLIPKGSGKNRRKSHIFFKEVGDSGVATYCNLQLRARRFQISEEPKGELCKVCATRSENQQTPVKPPRIPKGQSVPKGRTNEARWRELQQMPYSEYLETPEWEYTRKRALQKAQKRCQICGNIRQLNVHHRTYERKGRERRNDVIVLCSECHTLFHQNSRLKDTVKKGTQAESPKKATQAELPVIRQKSQLSREDLIESALRQTRQPGDYWSKVTEFLESIGKTPRQNLSERQQAWLERVEVELGKQG